MARHPVQPASAAAQPVVHRSRDRLTCARDGRKRHRVRAAERAAASQPSRRACRRARRGPAERTSLLQAHRAQPPGVAAAVAGDPPPAAGVCRALCVCRYPLQPGAAGRGPLRRRPVRFRGILPGARRAGAARANVDAGRRSGRVCECAGGHQPRAVAGRVRRRRRHPVANAHPPLRAPPHRRHRSRNLPGRGGGPPFRGGAPRLRRGIRSSRSLVAGGHGPARARVDTVRR